MTTQNLITLIWYILYILLNNLCDRFLLLCCLNYCWYFVTNRLSNSSSEAKGRFCAASVMGLAFLAESWALLKISSSHSCHFFILTFNCQSKENPVFPRQCSKMMVLCLFCLVVKEFQKPYLNAEPQKENIGSNSWYSNMLLPFCFFFIFHSYWRKYIKKR